MESDEGQSERKKPYLRSSSFEGRLEKFLAASAAASKAWGSENNRCDKRGWESEIGKSGGQSSAGRTQGHGPLSKDQTPHKGGEQGDGIVR